jgi:hypothetical protein
MTKLLISLLAVPLFAQHQLTLDELRACNRKIETYQTRPEKEKPPKPPHMTVENMRLWEMGYVSAVHSYKDKLWVLKTNDVYSTPTKYDRISYDIGIKKSFKGVWIDCAGSPFVIIDDTDDTDFYLPVDGQYNSKKK